jgi:Flp pilus assembly protein TadD
MGQLDNAITDYNAALRSRPKNATSLYGRGLALKRKHRIDAARTDIEAALAADPTVSEFFKELE